MNESKAGNGCALNIISMKGNANFVWLVLKMVFEKIEKKIDRTTDRQTDRLYR